MYVACLDVPSSAFTTEPILMRCQKIRNNYLEVIR